MTKNFDENYLDSLLSDLEKVTDHLPNRSGSQMNSSNRKATTTVTKYEYNKSNVGNEPIYQNDRRTNTNDLNTFLNEFEQTKESSYNRYGQTNGYSSSNYESSSQQVNQLISNLERNLANPNEALKYRGEHVRPIKMTEYYEESKKVKNLTSSDNLKHSTNVSIDRNYTTNERIRSVSPARSPSRGRGLSDIQQIKNAKPQSDAILTTTNYETTATKKYPVTSSSATQSATTNYQSSKSSSNLVGNQNLREQRLAQSSSNSVSNQNLREQQRSAQSNIYNQQTKQTSRASNATHELEDLMATLDDFNINDHQKQVKTTTQFSITKGQTKGESLTDGPEYASIIKNRSKEDSFHQRSSSSSRNDQQQLRPTISETRTTTSSKEIKNLGPLENIIGSIEIEMNKQGLETLAKGNCFTCHKAIVGQVITALGRQYHPQHFTCTHCKQELGERTFFEREGQVFCEPDYHELFAPKCNYCSAPITGRQKCVSALNTTFHAEHFFCHECNVQFTEDKGYHEHNNRAYCADCYLNIFAPKCTDCSKPITAAFISALGGNWHPHCFVCTDCRCEFAAGAFFEYEGKPYCETHFHAKKGTLCAGCHNPITGRCVTAMFRKFHPEHFVCSYCLKQLNKGTFKEQNDKPYCHTCFERVFS